MVALMSDSTNQQFQVIPYHNPQYFFYPSAYTHTLTHTHARRAARREKFPLFLSLLRIFEEEVVKNSCSDTHICGFSSKETWRILALSPTLRTSEQEDVKDSRSFTHIYGSPSRKMLKIVALFPTFTNIPGRRAKFSLFRPRLRISEQEDVKNVSSFTLNWRKSEQQDVNNSRSFTHIYGSPIRKTWKISALSPTFADLRAGRGEKFPLFHPHLRISEQEVVKNSRSFTHIYGSSSRKTWTIPAVSPTFTDLQAARREKFPLFLSLLRISEEKVLKNSRSVTHICGFSSKETWRILALYPHYGPPSRKTWKIPALSPTVTHLQAERC